MIRCPSIEISTAISSSSTPNFSSLPRSLWHRPRDRVGDWRLCRITQREFAKSSGNQEARVDRIMPTAIKTTPSKSKPVFPNAAFIAWLLRSAMALSRSARSRADRRFVSLSRLMIFWSRRATAIFARRPRPTVGQPRPGWRRPVTSRWRLPAHISWVFPPRWRARRDTLSDLTPSILQAACGSW
jgi:hypothetical protein